MKRHNKHWTPKEERDLMYMWGNRGTDKIAQALGRTPNAVVHKAQRMRLGRQSRGSMTMREVTDKLGVDSGVVKREAARLNIRLRKTISKLGYKVRNQSQYIIKVSQYEKIKRSLLERNFAPYRENYRGMWGVGKKPDACIVCGTTERAHFGLGKCQRCYRAEYNKRKKEERERESGSSC